MTENDGLNHFLKLLILYGLSKRNAVTFLTQYFPVILRTITARD